jgi:hypothetical protein
MREKPVWAQAELDLIRFRVDRNPLVEYQERTQVLSWSNYLKVRRPK